MKKLNNFLLIPNTSKNIHPEHIRNIAVQLTDRGCKVGVLPENKDLFDYISDLTVQDEYEDYIKHCQAAIVLGGDGSIIEAAHRLMGYDIPIVGINYGHVGFLAALKTNELSLLNALTYGAYSIDTRMMLDAEVTDDKGNSKGMFTVLNDIVLTNGPVARLITFDVYCNKIKIQTCRSDGMIVSTPTGSTAYSLSAGGPVLDPSLSGICLTPICPHTLTSRPVIFGGESLITLENIRNNNSSVYLNADGRDILSIESGDRITIRRSHYTTKIIRIKEEGFLEVLRSKLSE